jgi:hypothetical protein
MPTSFATTTFTVLVTINSYGALSPVDKSVLPPGTSGPILWNVDQCNYTRGKMEHPEKYTCQVFTSAKSTAWTYTPPGSEGHGCEGLDASKLMDGCGSITPQEKVQPDTNPERRSELEPTTKLPRAKDDVQLAGGYYHRSYPLWIWVADDSAVAEKDKPYIEPLVEGAAAPQPAKPKRVVVRRQQQYQPGPFQVIASLFTGNW